MEIELIGCESGDWEVLKLGDIILAENHKLIKWDWIDFLEGYCDISVIQKTISDDDMENSNY